MTPRQIELARHALGREMSAAHEYRFEIWQDGMSVAEGSGSDLDAVRREAMHYAMVYAQDGKVEIRSPDYDALFGSLAARPDVPAPETEKGPAR